jgi:hypothetical protein
MMSASVRTPADRRILIESIERFFRNPIEKVVPLVQAINAQHTLQRQQRVTTCRTCRRVTRLD